MSGGEARGCGPLSSRGGEGRGEEKAIGRRLPAYARVSLSSRGAEGRGEKKTVATRLPT